VRTSTREYWNKLNSESAAKKNRGGRGMNYEGLLKVEGANDGGLGLWKMKKLQFGFCIRLDMHLAFIYLFL